MKKLGKRFWTFLILGIVSEISFGLFAPQLLIKVKEEIYHLDKKEFIPYKIQEIKTNTYKNKELFEGEKVVETAGKEGYIKYRFWFKKIWVNGRLYKDPEKPFKREKIDEKSPRTEVVYVGTKTPYPTNYTYHFKGYFYEEYLDRFDSVEFTFSVQEIVGGTSALLGWFPSDGLAIQTNIIPDLNIYLIYRPLNIKIESNSLGTYPSEGFYLFTDFEDEEGNDINWRTYDFVKNTDLVFENYTKTQSKDAPDVSVPLEKFWKGPPKISQQ